jgi:hypothetical protein
MNFRERALCHQIHPVKLLTDGATAIGAAVLLWQHRAAAALLLGFGPSLVISALLIGGVDLEPYRRSPPGQYLARSMTRAMEAARFGGLALFWGGAWLHRPLLMASGLLIIALAWLRGKLWPGRGAGSGPR